MSESGAVMKNTLVDKYYADIKSINRVLPKDHESLAHRIVAGDEKSRNQMIEGNLRLVMKIARKYENCGLPIEDLISEGNIGLIKAVDKFDPTIGTKFSTYAAYWIKQTILRAIGQQTRTVRIPVHMLEKMSKLRKAEEHTENEAVALEDLAEMSGLSIKQIKQTEAAKQTTIYLDSPIPGEDSDLNWHSRIYDEDEPSQIDLIDQKNAFQNLVPAMDYLTERERAVIIKRFGLDGSEPMTLQAIARDHGLSRERIRQIEKIAISNLQLILKNMQNQPTHSAPTEDQAA